MLGDGELPFPLTIKAEQFSTSAREKIEAAGVVCCRCFACSLTHHCRQGAFELCKSPKTFQRSTWGFA